MTQLSEDIILEIARFMPIADNLLFAIRWSYDINQELLSRLGIVRLTPDKLLRMDMTDEVSTYAYPEIIAMYILSIPATSDTEIIASELLNNTRWVTHDDDVYRAIDYWIHGCMPTPMIYRLCRYNAIFSVALLRLPNKIFDMSVMAHGRSVHRMYTLMRRPFGYWVVNLCNMCPTIRDLERILSCAQWRQYTKKTLADTHVFKEHHTRLLGMFI